MLRPNNADESISAVSRAASKLRYSALPAVKDLVQTKLEISDDSEMHFEPEAQPALKDLKLDSESYLNKRSPRIAPQKLPKVEKSVEKPRPRQASQAMPSYISSVLQHSTPLKEYSTEWPSHRSTWLDAPDYNESKSSPLNTKESRAHEIISQQISSHPKLTQSAPSELAGSSRATIPSSGDRLEASSDLLLSVRPAISPKDPPLQRHRNMTRFAVAGLILLAALTACYCYIGRLKNLYLAELGEFVILDTEKNMRVKRYNWEILKDLEAVDRKHKYAHAFR